MKQPTTDGLTSIHPSRSSGNDHRYDSHVQEERVFEAQWKRGEKSSGESAVHGQAEHMDNFTHPLLQLGLCQSIACVTSDKGVLLVVRMVH